MGQKKWSFTNSRSEFVNDGMLESSMEYQRKGGCFVSTKKAVALAILAIAVAATVVALMYFYGPRKKVVTKLEKNADIEQILDDSIVNDEPDKLRLPSTTVPLYYRLYLEPEISETNTDNFTFTGKVVILFEATKPVKEILLNVDTLEILNLNITTTKSVHVIQSGSLTLDRPQNASLEQDSHVPMTGTSKEPSSHNHHESASGFDSADEDVTGVIMRMVPDKTHPNSSHENGVAGNVVMESEVIVVPISSHSEYEDDERYSIRFTHPLQPKHNYSLSIEFRGNITDNLIGLYKTSYTDSQGIERWILATNFQPAYARRAFPCFDEPAFKAPFEISIARRTDMVALSNMPIRESIRMSKSGWVQDHFETTPSFPPYQLAYGVFYNYIKLHSNSTALGHIINIWTPKDIQTNALYALQCACRIFEFLHDYLNVKVQLSKIDIIAVPELLTEATPTWGLISIRSSALLFNPSIDQATQQRHIFRTLANALTQHTFGHLVAIEWWTDIWMVESFATYMEYAIEESISSVPRVEDFSSRIMVDVLDFERLKSSRPLKRNITHHLEIDEIQDSLIYNHGSCLFRMLNHTLTAPVFKEGIQQFLGSNATANENKLWTALTNVSRQHQTLPNELSLEEVMESWTNQVGFPVVTVTGNCSADEVEVRQNSFVQDQMNSSTHWYIPLTYLVGNESNSSNITTKWMLDEEALVIRNVSCGHDSWLLFNVDVIGPYRVNYDESNWRLLQQQLETNLTTIPLLNRVQLLSDAFALAKAGNLNYTIPLGLTKYLVDEKSYLPWEAAFRGLGDMDFVISNSRFNHLYLDYVGNLIKPAYMGLGTSHKKKEAENDKLLRMLIIDAACEVGFDDCLKWATSEYQKWMNTSHPDKTNPIPSEFRRIVECYAIENGNKQEWEFLWNRTLASQISSDDLEIAYEALGCSREPWLIINYLENALNGSVSIQYVPNVWKSISRPVGLSTGLNFLRNNWNRIYTAYEDLFPILNAIFTDFLSKLSTKIDLEDVAQFYTSNQESLHEANSLLLPVVDRIKSRVRWSEAHLDTVVSWLNANGEPDTSN